MDFTIGQRIRQRRNELHIIQGQIQKSTGISSSYLSSIENGKNLPSAIALIELSQALACSVDWILTGKPSQLLPSENPFFLSEEQQRLVEAYNRLDSRGRNRIHTIMYRELDRIEMHKKNSLPK